MSDVALALEQALIHFEAMDRANAAIHCSTVRYSPLTFRLAEALEAIGKHEGVPAALTVLVHKGAYAEDPGR